MVPRACYDQVLDIWGGKEKRKRDREKGSGQREGQEKESAPKLFSFGTSCHALLCLPCRLSSCPGRTCLAEIRTQVWTFAFHRVELWCGAVGGREAEEQELVRLVSRVLGLEPLEEKRVACVPQELRQWADGNEQHSSGLAVEERSGGGRGRGRCCMGPTARLAET